ncbi:MAG: hypothetical protein QMB78_06900, partial [Rhodospirillales bacterium]
KKLPETFYVSGTLKGGLVYATFISLRNVSTSVHNSVDCLAISLAADDTSFEAAPVCCAAIDTSVTFFVTS